MSGELIIVTDEKVFEHASQWSVLAAEVRNYDNKVSAHLEVPRMESMTSIEP